MVDIIQHEHPVLRETARPVKDEEFGSDELNRVIADMKTALDSQDDGVAIAAPQIGESLRIFVVSRKVFAYRDANESDEVDVDTYEDKVFINPEIVNTSQKTVELDEGCLSVRWKYGKVTRFAQATVRAQDEHGEEFTLGAGGLLSQIFQHETDHLDGVLFIDKASDLKDIPPQNEPSDT